MYISIRCESRIFNNLGISLIIPAVALRTLCTMNLIGNLVVSGTKLCPVNQI